MLSSLQRRRSVESTSPILERLPTDLQEKRLSIYSLTPSLPISEHSFDFTTMEKKPVVSEIQEYHTSLNRLESRTLQQQRYTVSQKKDEHMSMLAFEAKVQRALGKRFSDQDAVFSGSNNNTHSKENRDANMALVLERALARRLSGQDAVFSPKTLFSKKPPVAVVKV